MSFLKTKLVFMVLLTATSSVLASTSSADDFSGNWSGLGTYQAGMQLIACDSVSMHFAADDTHFTFEGGQRVCGTSTEPFARVELEVRDKILYYDQRPVGIASPGLVVVDFLFGSSHYSLRMEAHGQTLHYSESLSAPEDPNPSVSFTGLLLRN